MDSIRENITWYRQSLGEQQAHIILVNLCCKNLNALVAVNKDFYIYSVLFTFKDLRNIGNTWLVYMLMNAVNFGVINTSW